MLMENQGFGPTSGGQVALRKLAKWPFGGLLVVLRACRQQLGWHVGFKIGLERPGSSEVGPNLAPTWLQEGSRQDLPLRGVFYICLS